MEYLEIKTHFIFRNKEIIFPFYFVNNTYILNMQQVKSLLFL